MSTPAFFDIGSITSWVGMEAARLRALRRSVSGEFLRFEPTFPRLTVRLPGERQSRGGNAKDEASSVGIPDFERAFPPVPVGAAMGLNRKGGGNQTGKDTTRSRLSKNDRFRTLSGPLFKS